MGTGHENRAWEQGMEAALDANTHTNRVVQTLFIATLPFPECATLLCRNLKALYLMHHPDAFFVSIGHVGPLLQLTQYAQDYWVQ